MDSSETIRQQVSVERLVHGGSGLLRLPDGVAFVDGVIAGELVEVGAPRMVGRQRRVPLLRILNPAPERVVPPCPVVERCGGCGWQHISHAGQLAAKRAILAENLLRLGGVSVAATEIETVAGTPWEYRSRVQLHGTPEGQPAFRERGSHELVPVDDCMVADPRIRAALPKVRLEPGARVTLVAGAPGPAAGGGSAADGAPGVARSDRDAAVTVRVGNLPFRFHPGSFAQSNFELLPALGEHLAAAAGDAEEFVDLFAGAGLLPALILAHLPAGARPPRRVLCVEPDRRNQQLAEANIRHAVELRSGSSGATVPIPEIISVAQRAETALREGLLKGRALRTVLVDPPRAGLSGRLRRALGAVSPRAVQRLLYLSCDAATLARDLGELQAAFAIDSITLFDFFPQTAHIETLVCMSRRESRHP